MRPALSLAPGALGVVVGVQQRRPRRRPNAQRVALAFSTSARNSPSVIHATHASPFTQMTGANTLVITKAQVVLKRIELTTNDATNCTADAGSTMSPDHMGGGSGGMAARWRLRVRGAARRSDDRRSAGGCVGDELDRRDRSGRARTGRSRRGSMRCATARRASQGLPRGASDLRRRGGACRGDLQRHPLHLRRPDERRDRADVRSAGGGGLHGTQHHGERGPRHLVRGQRQASSSIPSTANDGGANAALVAHNIHESFEAFEDENHDGHDDHKP